MRNLTFIFMLIVLLFLNGCGTIKKMTAEEMDQRYYATKVCFRAYGKDSASRWMYDDLYCITPIVLIDVPLSFVLDTLEYPFDYIAYKNRVKTLAFWNEVFKSNDAVLLKQEYIKYFDWYSAKYIEQKIQTDHWGKNLINSNIIDLAVDLSLINPRDTHSKNILLVAAEHHKISQNTYQKLYDFSYSIGKELFLSDYVLERLARNPSTPSKYFETYVNDSNSRIRVSAALNPSLPKEISERLKNDANNTIKTEMLKTKPDWRNVNNSKELIKALNENK